MIGILKAKSPVWATTYFYVVVTLQFFGRILFGTYAGTLLVSIVIYQTARQLGLDVFGPQELALWVDGLNESAKETILASGLTILGFAIAFSVATRSWKDQMYAQVRLQVSTEFDAFLAPLSRALTEMGVFADQVVESYAELQSVSMDDFDSRFIVRYNREQYQNFIEARNVVSRASSEVHTLIGRNYAVLATGWGILEMANTTTALITEVSERMWVHFPIVDDRSPSHKDEYMDGIDIEKWRGLSQLLDDNPNKIAGLCGGIRGALGSVVVPTTLPSYVSLVSNYKGFLEMVRDYNKKLRASG